MLRTLVIERFTANSLGCCVGFSGPLGGEFFPDLLDELLIALGAALRPLCPSSVFRILPVPCAVFLGAGGAARLLVYRCLAAAAQPLFVALLAGKGWLFAVRWPVFWSGGCRFLAWVGLCLFALALVAGSALALGYEYGVNKKLWF